MSMSLPTPPRTSQKNKENVSPIPLTPATSICRTPRIVWSQENLHHAYTTQIRQLPSSSSTKEPQKSILKKPSRPLMSLVPPQEPVREVTPEPADPLQHPLYLNSPVLTLITSLQLGSDAKITLTDLTEAYSVLSARLKAKMQAMIEMCGPIPALEPLREHSDELVQTFHRDIGRAFVNPQSSPSPLEDSPWSSPSSVGSVKKRGYTEQEVKHARDLCNLCHAAMRCFSNIALVPVLSSIFNDSQLGDLLTAVLAIPLAPSLPTPNARKTCQIAVWILQIQRLPTAVLEPAADRITYALRRGIDGELGREGKKGSALDGLKAVASLASNQPTIFLRPFCEIIHSVFGHLTSQNLTLRLQAAHAILLLSRALSGLPSSDSDLLELFRQATSAYLIGQQNMRKSPQDLSPLGKEFRACFEVDIPTHAANSPMWALSVIAAFIALSESSTFTHPKTIKFVLGHLRTAMGVKRTTVRATAGLVWRALVWACVRLDASEQSQVHKDAGWKVVRQILDGAIGISVVAALVGGKERQERISQALEAVRIMIKKGGRTCEEGVDVLERLLSSVGSGLEEPREDVWSDQKLLPEPLFNGSLLHAEWKGLASHVKEALNQSVAVQDVTPLHENEVVQHWDTLFDIWKEAVERAPLGEDGDVPPALLGTWQALLLTQAQLTQGFEHLTSTPSFILHLTGLLKSFLIDTSLEWSLDASAPSWQSQPLKLGFVRNLWTVARNVFASSTLAGAAQTLLYEILKRDYMLGQSEVRDAWASLCAELVLVGLPQLIRELWTEQERGQEEEIKRGLWRVVSKRWIDSACSWGGAIELLKAPFTLPIHWEFDGDDLKLWVRLVDCALLTASVRKVSTVTVLDMIAGEIGTGRNYESLYAALPYLLSGIDASPPPPQDPPRHPHVLLKLTRDILAENYPPSDPRSKRMMLVIIESLREIVQIAPDELLVEFLACIQDGVRPWIIDEREVFSEHEYNEQIVSFYVDSLEALKKLPASVDIIHKLSPLLISAFDRVPEPALGPSSFKSFWTTLYTPLALSSHCLPEDLKPVLRAVQDAMCDPTEKLGYLSPETQTQGLGTMELPLSVIPDSLERGGTILQRQGIEVGRLSTSEGPIERIKSIQDFEQQTIEVEKSSEPVLDAHADIEPVATSLELQSVDPDRLEPISDNRGSEDHHVLGSLVEPSKALPIKRNQTVSLESSSVPEIPSSYGSSAADPCPDNTVPRNFVSSIGLKRAPLTSLLEHDLFIVEDSKPFLPTSTSMESAKTSYVRAIPPSPRVIKEEHPEINPDNAMMLGLSQDSSSSQRSKFNNALGKRRRPRFASHSNKKRKVGPGAGIEIINLSDDESSEQVSLNLSIVVAPVQRRKSLDTRVISQKPFQASTPTPEVQDPSTTSSRKKRTFFEAVELPTLQELLKKRNLSVGASNRSKKTMTRTASTSRISHKSSTRDNGPSKRLRVNSESGKGKQKAIEDWSDDSPAYSLFFGPLSSLEPSSDDTETRLTPQPPSDSSVLRPGQISAGHIISPLPRRSRSEAYDIPSEDDSMPSSPLKHVAARRIQRARTLPVLPTNAPPRPIRPVLGRKRSEEFLALERANAVISSGASRMGLHDLRETGQKASQLGAVLDDEVTKKTTVDKNQTGPS